MTEILHHFDTDPQRRKEIEDEHEAWRSVNALFEKKERGYIKALEEKDNELEAQRKLIEELQKQLKKK